MKIIKGEKAEGRGQRAEVNFTNDLGLLYFIIRSLNWSNLHKLPIANYLSKINTTHNFIKMFYQPFVHVLSQLNFSLRSLVMREKSLWLLHQPYILWNQKKKQIRGIHPKESIITSSTEIVIDGFQGSANSFATVAFKESQTKFVNLAHHLHSPAQVMQATEKKIPVLLTIREPEGAILSLTGRWSYISVESALKSYIGFYSKLTPYNKDLIISTFPQTTKNLDRVVARINARFETDFDLVNLNTIDRSSIAKVEDSPDIYASKQKIKSYKKEELALAKNQKLLKKAQEIYQEWARLEQEQIKIYLHKSNN